MLSSIPIDSVNIHSTLKSFFIDAFEAREAYELFLLSSEKKIFVMLWLLVYSLKIGD